MKILALITLIPALTLALAKWKRADYEDFVKKHNNKKLSWTAQLDDEIRYDDDALKSRLGLLPEPSTRALIETNEGQESVWPKTPRLLQTTPPATVDLRTQYPACAGTLNLVRNQSQCGSCWAFATATTGKPSKSRNVKVAPGPVRSNLSQTEYDTFLNDSIH